MRKDLYAVRQFVVTSLLIGTLQQISVRGQALGTGFAYQGMLKRAGAPVNGTCDLQFALWDSLAGGTQVGTVSFVAGVSVSNGMFSATINAGGEFGVTAFTGLERYLAIAVQCTGDPGFTPLSPRQRVSPTPYGLYALKAPWSGLTGVPAGFADGTDNDTIYSAGTGLTLSGTTFSIDTGQTQARVTGNCAAGSSIRAIAADGTVTCETDDNSGGTVTAVTASAPLASSGGAAPNISITGILPPANGGTGSATKNFVDLTTDQTVGGTKTFSNAPVFGAAGTPFSVSGGGLVTNLNADRLDGEHATVFQKRYQNIKVVAKSGGDFTTITDALNSITDAGAANPYLVYVAPGIYNERVTMKPYVDIEGSGERTTKITFTGDASSSTSTVRMFGTTELRFLTVENTGGADYATAIYSSGSGSLDTSPSLIHITVWASGGKTNQGVVNYGTLTMNNVRLSAWGGDNSFGVLNHGDTAMIRVNVGARNGSISNNGILNRYRLGIENSKIFGWGQKAYAILNKSDSPIPPTSTVAIVSVVYSYISGSIGSIGNEKGYTTFVGASELIGQVVNNGGTAVCVASWWTNSSAPLNSDCR